MRRETLSAVLNLDRIDSPAGAILLTFDGDGVVRTLHFADREARMRRHVLRWPGGVTLREARAPSAVRDALAAYFAGEMGALAAITCRADGTVFQQRVWAALRDIPPGVTESYGGLAARIGNPKAVRAVGLANGANPISIITPCHRVIGASGGLTGYGGGLERKRWLLAHEGALGEV